MNGKTLSRTCRNSPRSRLAARAVPNNGATAPRAARPENTALADIQYTLACRVSPAPRATRRVALVQTAVGRRRVVHAVMHAVHAAPGAARSHGRGGCAVQVLVNLRCIPPVRSGGGVAPSQRGRRAERVSAVPVWRASAEPLRRGGADRGRSLRRGHVGEVTAHRRSQA